MVYHIDSMSRTNLEINAEQLDRIMRRYGVRTKTEAVDLALRHLSGQPLTMSEALEMRGAFAIGNIPDDIGP
jgi:Arc/MetJ family transcription regulator